MQIFYKIFKILKVFDDYIFAECPHNQNFGDAIAVQDVSGIHVWNFVRCSPLEPKFLSRYWYNCTLYITVVLGQLQYLNERKMGIQFYVIILILL